MRSAVPRRGEPQCALLRSLFAWAVKAKYIETSPATDLEKPHNEKPRQRVLSEDEIRAFGSFHQHGLSLRRARLAAADARPAERRDRCHGVAQLDLDRGVWRLPAP